uniref:Si:ch211-194e15.5 n=1 Tax=Gasterosteus aculeatus TaxID=69293 RepID=G3P153_GASAC
ICQGAGVGMVVYLRKSIHALLSVFKKKAGPKGNEDQKRLTVHYRTSQHYQENVFIEGSRPQYLEDLHSEAQEGLKILQREDNLRPEQDIGSKDGGGSPVSTSTAGSTDTTLTSAASSRPPLTRQETGCQIMVMRKVYLCCSGSTFKPLNPVKGQDKSRKRSRRTTIMGIPNQVQKELGMSTQLDSTPNHDGKLINSQSGVVTVPTVDVETPASHEEEPKVHLSELENGLLSNTKQSTVEEQLLRKHLKAMFHDEQTSNHQGSGNCFCPTSIARPKSLAVPGTTTSFSLCPSEPQGPVMSISPQATYLSTIIPNAVLPASIEVIEIDLSSSRTRGSSVNQSGHIHTVSRSSLASGDLSVSPLLSRRSDGDGSQTDNSHDESALMPLSALGFNWSESQSSKTVSNSSPVSSKGSTLSGNLRRVSLNGRESQTEKSSRDQDFVSPASSSQGSKSVSGSVASGDDEKTTQNFNRSLSVMKTKQPPAPPRRTNSLHGNKISSKPKVLVDFNDSVSGDGANATERIVTKDEMKPIISAEGATEPQCSSSSPQKTSSEESKFERTVSPSSGYSSQSGTPTLSPKGISPTSPDKQKMKPVKPERSVSRASSSAASPASSLTSLSSGTSDPVNPDDNKSQALGAEVRELLNLPPPPKVKAPCAPPPETSTSPERGVTLLADNSDEAMDKSEVTSTQTLSVEVPKVGKASPPPTPPPSYHPTPPPSRKTPPSSVSTPPGELHRVQEENPPGESSWPPPPPPMEGDSVFYGGEEVDFPPPPPPLPTDSEPGAAHPSPSNTRAENPASVPPCSFLKHDAPTERPVSAQPPASVPVAPALPADNFPQGITFRRQPSVPNRDPRSKELLNRHKSAPIPKEDANIPLVTPSLLQMVRLRSVNMTEDQENCSTSVPGPQTVPQKPIRKSLSMKSPQAVKTSSALHPPSMRLQEAIRMKTAAMSSRDGLPSRLGVRSSTYSPVSEQGSLKPPEGCDMHKSPASTASFIFSRGTKKVIFETTGASSPEAQAGLKQSLAAELTRVSDRSKCIANGGLKLDKVPPPVAKKPT